MRQRLLPPAVVLCLASMLVGCASNHSPARSPSSHAAAREAAPSPTRRLADQPPDPKDLDLRDLVPGAGRIDHVWYVPAGQTVPEVAVGWSYHSRHVPSTLTDERYALTVWHPDRMTPGSARWTPHTLFRGSPFPFRSTSVRTADVTGDGHPDLLVTIECNGCNHATASASIFADRGEKVVRIYGTGFLDGSKGEHVGVQGRVISETAWGASRGRVWFDEPRGGGSVCCPTYRLQTFLLWQRGSWRTVMTRKLLPGRDRFLGQRPVPAP
jgi:hypothetical protein